MPRKIPPNSVKKGAPSRAQRYRDRADYLRGMARRTNDAQVRRELQRIVRDCEARAASMSEAAD